MTNLFPYIIFNIFPIAILIEVHICLSNINQCLVIIHNWYKVHEFYICLEYA